MIKKIITIALLSCFLMFESSTVTAYAAEDTTETVCVPDGDTTEKEVGNVTVEDDSNHVEGVNVSAGAENVSVTVDGDVTVKNTKDRGSTDGIDVESNSSGDNTENVSAEVYVSGDVNVEAGSKRTSQTSGISSQANGEGGISTVIVDGKVNVKGSDNSQYIKGVNNRADDGGKSSVTINGGLDLSGTTEVRGIYNGEEGLNGSTNEVTVKGDVNVTGGSYVSGIVNMANRGDTSTVTIDGNVTGKTLSGGLSGVDAESKSFGEKGKASTTVSGNVVIEGGPSVEGAWARSTGMGESEITIGGDVLVSNPYSYGSYGVRAYTFAQGEYDAPSASINVGGTIKVDGGNQGYFKPYGILAGNHGGKILVSSGEGVSSPSVGVRSYNESPTHSGSNTILINGNITAETGLEISTVGLQNTSDIFTHDILVDGVISGSKSGVVLYKKTEQQEGTNVLLTVWKIEPVKNNHVAEAYVEKKDPTTGEILNEAVDATSFEKSIKYIIKMEQPKTGGSFSLTDKDGNALAQSHDREVAYEGDTVLMKVNLDPHYKILAAYNGEGKTQKLVMDSNGNYYVVVPRGGGVFLSVELGKETYKATFEDEDGKVLQSNDVDYDKTPSYTGKEPTKAPTVGRRIESGGSGELFTA